MPVIDVNEKKIFADQTEMKTFHSVKYTINKYLYICIKFKYINNNNIS